MACCAFLIGCGAAASDTGDAITPPPIVRDTIPTPSFPPAARVVALAGGPTSSCALVASGDAYCWGENRFGDLGDGTGRPQSTPVKVLAAVPFASIAGTHGTPRFCTIDQAARAYCWGYNLNGELGDGTRTDRLVPTPVAGNLQFASITSSYHTCGLTLQGRAYCWGLALGGGLGQDPIGEDRSTPVAVAGGHTFTSIVAGMEYGCALTAAGETYCWGAMTVSSNGQYGPAPAKVVEAPAFTEISGGEQHVCGLASGGALYCWGKSNGVFDPWVNSPTRVTGVPALKHVVLGYDQTCGLTDDGTAWCWLPGRNRVPRVTAPTLRFAGLAGGRENTCGFTARGEVYCWNTAFLDGPPTRVIIPGQ
jgi:alpha-tubulin suppressor-like RCC1 family protein